MLSMKIVFQILFVSQESDLVFSSEFEKIALQKNNNIKIAPFPTHTRTHTTQIKIQHDKVSISGPQGMGTQIFYKTIKFCVLVNFIVEDWCFAYIV